MKYFFYTLSLAVLLTSTYFLSCMEVKEAPRAVELDNNMTQKQFFASLPKEIRGYIISLALQAGFRYKFELHKAIDTGAGTSFLAASADGATVFAANSFTAFLYDRQTGQSLFHFNVYGKEILAVSFSKGFVLVKQDQKVELINIRTANTYLELVHIDEVTAAAFNQKGTHIITGLKNGRVYIWDIEKLMQEGQRSYTTNKAKKLKRPHPGPICSVAFSNDETLLLTGSKAVVDLFSTIPSYLCLWDAKTKGLSDTVRWNPINATETGFVITPDALKSNNKTFFTQTDNGSIVMRSLTTGDRISTLKRKGYASLEGIHDGTVILFDRSNGEVVAVNSSNDLNIQTFSESQIAGEMFSFSRALGSLALDRTKSIPAIFTEDGSFVLVAKDRKIFIWQKKEIDFERDKEILIKKYNELGKKNNYHLLLAQELENELPQEAVPQNAGEPEQASSLCLIQ